MTRLNVAVRIILIASSLTFGGCRFKKAKANTPAPIITAPPSVPTAPPPAISAPPKVDEPKSAQIPSLPPGTSPQVDVPKPPKQQKPSKRTPVATRPPTSSPATSAPATPSQTEAPATLPQLAPLLSAEQRSELNTAIDGSLRRAAINAGRARNRRLTPDQQATLARVDSFMKQAQEARATDLAVAKSLAERADLLADDLARSVR